MRARELITNLPFESSMQAAYYTHFARPIADESLARRVLGFASHFSELSARRLTTESGAESVLFAFGRVFAFGRIEEWMMPIQLSCSAPPFTAQKSRKLLISVQISLFGASNMPTNCRLRVTVVTTSIPQVLTIQSIPNMWDVVTTNMVVQSTNTFDPNGVVTNFVAFPAFFDSRSPTTPDSYSATYQVDLMDANTGLPVESRQ